MHIHLLLFSVSERTQRNFDEAMKDGKLWIRCGNSFLLGPGGSGKTHTLSAILKEKPPSLRQSTPCAKKPVRAVAQCRLGVHDETCFVRITDEQYSDMLSTTAKLFPQSQTCPQQRDQALAQNSGRNSTSLPPMKRRRTESASTSSTPVQSLHSGFKRELLVRMNAGSKAANQLRDKDMFNISDSGGQPMFHEVLPVFVTNTMIGMLTVKLNESLDSHPLVEYYTNGEPIGKPFKSPFTHLQIFCHCMRVLQSTCEHGTCPKIVFIGTHKDLELNCQHENREEKD